jgi:hypothetical protein
MLMLRPRMENNKTSPLRQRQSSIVIFFKTNELVKPRGKKKKSVKHVSEGGRVGKKIRNGRQAIEAQS